MEKKCKVTFEDGHVEIAIVLERKGPATLVVDFMGEAGTYTFIQAADDKWYWEHDTDYVHPHQIEIEQHVLTPEELARN